MRLGACNRAFISDKSVLPLTVHVLFALIVVIVVSIFLACGYTSVKPIISRDLP